MGQRPQVPQFAVAVLVGGAEVLLMPFAFGVACAVGTLSRRNDSSQKASRPFERDRDGIVLGEGASALVLGKAEP